MAELNERLHDEQEDMEPPRGAVMMREMPHRRKQFVSFERRRALHTMAERIAADVLKNTRRHERCLVRAMVENLLPEEDGPELEK